MKSDGPVRHRAYNFVFNHDYKVEGGAITNYEVVRDRFDVKIQNFKEMLRSDATCVFITFSDEPWTLKIRDMDGWLARNKQRYHWLIFTDCVRHEVRDLPSTCSIVVLQSSYQSWWAMDRDTKRRLYAEIYGAFLGCLEGRGVHHGFSTDETQIAPL